MAQRSLAEAGDRKGTSSSHPNGQGQAERRAHGIGRDVFPLQAYFEEDVFSKFRAETEQHEPGKQRNNHLPQACSSSSREGQAKEGNDVRQGMKMPPGVQKLLGTRGHHREEYDPGQQKRGQSSVGESLSCAPAGAGEPHAR